MDQNRTKKIKKRNRVQGWFLTYPQCSRPKEELQEWLRTLDGYTKSVVCQEKHESGDLHLHAWVNFNTKKEFSPEKFDFPSQDGRSYHGNYQTCRNWRAVAQYLRKGGNFIEEGMPEVFKNEYKGTKMLTTCPKLLIEEGAVHPLKFDSLLRNQYLYKITFQPPYEHSECRGIWIYGPPGSGKSYYARKFLTETYTTFFLKSQTKWFDGYYDQKGILLDDLDSTCLGHLLKIWLDKYSCSGEVKGGSVPLIHQCFIVTSNYLPEDLWKDTPVNETIAIAIRRRCKFIKFATDHTYIEE